MLVIISENFNNNLILYDLCQILAPIKGLYMFIPRRNEGQTRGRPDDNRQGCETEKRKQKPKGTIKMTNMIKNFAADESGAVTVDFVVLTAAIVGLSIALMSTLTTGIGNLTTQIGGDLADELD